MVSSITFKNDDAHQVTIIIFLVWPLKLMTTLKKQTEMLYHVADLYIGTGHLSIPFSCFMVSLQAVLFIIPETLKVDHKNK